jgi:peptidyl-prolyl cis-trans isomerase A (cyclophilin A)
MDSQHERKNRMCNSICLLTAIGAVAVVAGVFQRSSAAAEGDPAPATYKVAVDTSKGKFVIEVHRDWAPNGADHFYHLVQEKFYDDVRFFRVIDGFMAQFGMNGDPAVNSKWKDKTIKDDPVKQSNKRGFVTFAMTGQPNSRSTQLFINFGDNSFLDKQRFAPIGQVVEGMEIVDSLHSGYGEGAPGGNGPSQGRIADQGNEYLKRDFPKLDYIKTARIVE